MQVPQFLAIPAAHDQGADGIGAVINAEGKHGGKEREVLEGRLAGQQTGRLSRNVVAAVT